MKNTFIKDAADRRVFEAAYAAWAGWENFRRKRRRNKDFTYGSQWGDMVTGADGRQCSEYRRLQESGHKPLTNNIIRRLVRSVVGRFRNSIAASNTGTSDLIDELDSRALEEFLISGCCVQRVDADLHGITVENLNVNRFFSNIMEDVHCRDCNIAGYLHDINVSELIGRLSYGNRNRAAKIRDVYRELDLRISGTNQVGEDSERSNGFFSAGRGLARAIEVWTLELQEVLECHDSTIGELYTVGLDKKADIDTENARRKADGAAEIKTNWSIDKAWHCRWFSPRRTMPAALYVKLYPQEPSLCRQTVPLDRRRSTLVCGRCYRPTEIYQPACNINRPRNGSKRQRRIVVSRCSIA